MKVAGRDSLRDGLSIDQGALESPFSLEGFWEVLKVWGWFRRFGEVCESLGMVLEGLGMVLDGFGRL